MRKILNIKKIGHAGTLDPFAKGVLPVAIGKATKTIEFCQNQEKKYIFEVVFGKETDTLDPTGKVIKTSISAVNKEDIISILPEFTGDIEQIPPIYSAIKVNGKRAYSIARKGEFFTMKPRKVSVKSIKLINFANIGTGVATFEVTCNKGTYIRSLARDIAYKLGSCGYVSSLERTRVGKFCKKDSILLENLEKLLHNTSSKIVKPIDYVLDDIPALSLAKADVIKLQNGLVLAFGGKSYSGLVRVYSKDNNNFIALAKIEESLIKAHKVFNMSQ